MQRKQRPHDPLVEGMRRNARSVRRGVRSARRGLFSFGSFKFFSTLFVVLVGMGTLWSFGVFGDTTIGLSLRVQPTLEQGLIGYWSFDDTSVTRIGVSDMSGQGNDAELGAATTTTWTLGSDTTISRIQSWGFDSVEGAMYFGMLGATGEADIYGCIGLASGDADGICESGEFILGFDGAQEYLLALAHDSLNEVMYAGQGGNAGDGDVYYCKPRVSGDGDRICESGEWTLTFDGAAEGVYSLLFDPTNKVMYAGQGATAGNGNMYYCKPGTAGDADGICESGEWTLGYDGTEEYLYSMERDSVNGVLYHGQGSDTGNGDVYYCNPTVSGDADGICEGGEWTQSFNGSQEFLNALVFDSGNQVMYAGQGSSAGDADVYYCKPGTAGDADGICESGEWTLGYDGSVDYVYTMIFDSINGVLHLGLGASSGNGDIYYCKPAVSGDADGICEGGEFALGFNGAQELIAALGFDSTNGVVYAGQGIGAGDADVYYLDARTNEPQRTAGKIGQALIFDGTDDVASSTDNPYDLTDMTIAAWVKTKQTSRGSIVTKGLSGDYQYGLEVNESTGANKLGFTLWQSAGSAYLSATSTSVINDGNWHHVVGVASGDTVTVYVDGVAEATDTTTSGTRDSSGAAKLMMGSRGDGSNDFNGSMDDVRVYNRALSTDEIQRLYQLAATTKIGVTLDTNPANREGLVAHWSFDGRNMRQNVANLVSGNYTGYLTNFSSTTTVPGKIGQGLSFDGLNDYVNMGDVLDFERTDPFTISLWAKVVASTTGTQYLVVKQDNNNVGEGYATAITSAGLLAFRLNNTQTTNSIAVNSTSRFDDNQWHHVVVTYSGSSAASGVRMYKDSVAETMTITVDNLSATTITSEELHIGCREQCSLGWLRGIVDDVRIYNRALSPGEIERIYELGATTKINTPIRANATLEDGLLGYWTFDGKNMYTTASDVSGKGNTGNLINFTSTTTSPGKIGQALTFDGSDDDVTTTNDDQITTAGTVAAWIYTTAYGVSGENYLHVIASQEATSGDSDFKIQLGDSTDAGKDNLVVDRRLNASDTISISTTDLALNTWYHVAGTWDGSTQRLYVNGVLEDADSASGAIPGADISAYKIGEYGSSAIRNWQGKIDEVHIYNRALTQTEIQRLYEIGN